MEHRNPAWFCSDCHTELVPTESGWVCPRMHGGIVADRLLADRLRVKAGQGDSSDWINAVRLARRSFRPGAQR